MRFFVGNPLAILKALAVFLTLAGAVPHVRCVCPDGRVKIVCLGSSCSSNCCCHPSEKSSTIPNDAAPAGTGLCEDHQPTCCSHQRQVPVLPSPQSDSIEAPCGCHQSLSAVAETVLSVAFDGVDADQDVGNAPMVWAAHDVASDNAYYPGRASIPIALPPPDLVVMYCHFNC